MTNVLNSFPGKEFLCNPSLPGVDLRILCERLRGSANSASRAKSTRASSPGDKSWTSVPDAAYDLLKQLLNPNHIERLSAEDALSHPFLISS